MHIIEYRQSIPTLLQTCWEFFSSPSNLKILTPSYLGFSENSNSAPMYEGQIIIHYIKPFLGLPIQWITEITHVKPLQYFIDEQRFGPYKFWHHQHRFREIPGGVQIIDTVHYMLPLGIIGRAVNHLKVRKDIEAIFNYRQSKITELFGIISD